MKAWAIEVEQNGGEYYSIVYITANSVEQLDDKVIIADGVVIEFDETIVDVG